MTTAPPDHEHVRELFGVYALGTADDDEARTVERHVVRCVPCHAELQSLLAAGESLALATVQQPMPSRLRVNILAALDDEPSRVELQHVMPVPQRRRRFSLRFAVPVAACLALAVAAAVVQTARLDEQVNQLGRLRSAAADRARSTDLPATSIAGTSRVVNMDTSGALAGSTVELLDVHGAGLLITKNLPTPPAGYEWKVWGVSAGHEMHAMGGLDPRAEDGMGLQPIIGLHDSRYEAVAITLERTVLPEGTQEGPVVGWARMA